MGRAFLGEEPEPTTVPSMGWTDILGEHSYAVGVVAAVVTVEFMPPSHTAMRGAKYGMRFPDVPTDQEQLDAWADSVAEMVRTTILMHGRLS